MHRSRAWIALAGVTTMLGAVVGLGTTPARAASTFAVTSTFDSGPGSLRQAVLDANANPGLDTITVSLPPTYVINLATTITSTDAVTVEGNGVAWTLEGPPAPIWVQTGGGAAT